MRKRNWLPIVSIFLGVYALIVLASVTLAFVMARNQAIYYNPSLGVTTINGRIDNPGDDPLITYVPEDERSLAGKTKVFVSSQDPIWGDDNAQVYLFLYGSLLDAEMQSYLGLVEAIYNDFGGQVAIVWKDNVASEADRNASIVGQCAHSYGRFWDYATALTERSSDDLADLKTVAVNHGVNAAELDFCLDTAGMGAVVDQSTALAAPLGATNQHTIFVNDNIYTDALSREDLIAHINETLAAF